MIIIRIRDVFESWKSSGSGVCFGTGGRRTVRCIYSFVFFKKNSKLSSAGLADRRDTYDSNERRHCAVSARAGRPRSASDRELRYRRERTAVRLAPPIVATLPVRMINDTQTRTIIIYCHVTSYDLRTNRPRRTFWQTISRGIGESHANARALP